MLFSLPLPFFELWSPFSHVFCIYLSFFISCSIYPFLLSFQVHFHIFCIYLPIFTFCSVFPFLSESIFTLILHLFIYIAVQSPFSYLFKSIFTSILHLLNYFFFLCCLLLSFHLLSLPIFLFVVLYPRSFELLSPFSRLFCIFLSIFICCSISSFFWCLHHTTAPSHCLPFFPSRTLSTLPPPTIPLIKK